jgi:HSP20 family protein
MARSTDWTSSPFALMRQGVDEMDRFFARLVGGSRSGEMPWAGARAATPGDWTPAIEAFQRGNEFVIRADIPGLKRNEITVEAGDDSIVIRGERKQEHRDNRDGLFWTERSYGTFHRVVPLPPGTITESAKASFSNGVLEIVMPAPPGEARRGRRIDISGTPATESPEKK